MRSCVIIPARYASSRFPGKPLVPLLGTPMIVWVANLSAKAVGRANVFVATDDARIAATVSDAGYKPLMTSESALTGTDRIAEAAKLIDYDLYINVQGDEPLVDPKDINTCIDVKANNLDKVVNGYTMLTASEDPSSPNIPKVVTTEKDQLVYMSRAPIPGTKGQPGPDLVYKKQVCIYGFTRQELFLFEEFGRKGLLEKWEDIEILRFLEIGIDVQMFKTSLGSLAVDVPEDVSMVERILRER